MNLSAIPFLLHCFFDIFDQYTFKKLIFFCEKKIKLRSSFILITNSATKSCYNFLQNAKVVIYIFLNWRNFLRFSYRVCKKNNESFCKFQKTVKIFLNKCEFF